MKHLFASLLLSFCLSSQTIASNHNDWRSMPFIEMMVAMMKAMNNMMGGSNSLYGFNALPYSPAFVPGMGGIPGVNGLNNLPMSPAGYNALPLSYMTSTINPFQNGFKTGSNHPGFKQSGAQASNNFWDPDTTHFTSVQTVNNDSMNGIWQASSGDVIAIYNNNRFLWSDGGTRNLAGQLAIKGNRMIAYIPAKKVTLYFQFYKEPGQFIVRDLNSRIYTFKRIH
ncbi:MAG: hypothetical protein KZQ70_05000 [gamma proteobacterium symbiont of Lucinoma myriamae]|nr:hypothetical protein [gamma proteobacterium symbiont of Lucinoma myriamae]MCU7818651.1 hypothetical protein [gamma proteobacterium symbiont of Lucinoma myriamae]MCU7831912.1 hypothetical protein [gamma proteobacterium symbiont of Lucinoma myriamae]